MVQVISWLEPTNGTTGSMRDAERAEALANRVSLLNAADVEPLTAKVQYTSTGRRDCSAVNILHTR